MMKYEYINLIAIKARVNFSRHADGSNPIHMRSAIQH